MHSQDKTRLFSFLITSASILLLSGCVRPTSSQIPAPVEKTPIPSTLTAAPLPTKPASTPPPTKTLVPSPTPTQGPQLSDLPPDPQRITFETADRFQLVGYYYPSRYQNAPVIILAHWAGGDQRDWCKIAPWLQNRMDESPAEMSGCAEAAARQNAPWWDETWFPAISQEVSYAVFTFDFRSYGESQKTSEWESFEDALAAFKTAATLPGIDSTRMVAAGASIGADGAPDGCDLYINFNKENNQPPGCIGAFSWSPGSFLGMNFDTVVADLKSQNPSVPVWCLASDGDIGAFQTCNKSEKNLAWYQIYTGTDAHGMLIITPNLAPNSLELLLNFLDDRFNTQQ